MKKSRHWGMGSFLVLLGIAWFAVTGGCGRKMVHKSVSATIGLRQVNAILDVADGVYPDIDASKGGYVDGPLAIYPSNDVARICFGSHQVAVEKEWLLLDGKRRVQIPPSTAHIELVLSKGMLKVSAEKENVMTVRMER